MQEQRVHLTSITVQVANQRLVQIETHITKRSPCLTLPREPGARGEVAQRPRLEAKMTEKKIKKFFKKVVKRFLMIFCYPHRPESSIIIIREISSTNLWV